MGGGGLVTPSRVRTQVRERVETGIKTLLTFDTQRKQQVIWPLNQYLDFERGRAKRRGCPVCFMESMLQRVPDLDALFLTIGCTQKESF